MPGKKKQKSATTTSTGKISSQLVWSTPKRKRRRPGREPAFFIGRNQHQVQRRAVVATDFRSGPIQSVWPLWDEEIFRQRGEVFETSKASSMTVFLPPQQRAGPPI